MPGNAYLSETNPARGVPNPTRVTKNLIAIGLLFALLAPPLLTGGWFQLERAGLRREARQKLLAGTAPEELVLLSFSEEEARQVLRWERDDEFEYNGHMYDVARVELLADGQCDVDRGGLAVGGSAGHVVDRLHAQDEFFD